MYENILLPLLIICVVTLMYCKKEIMKYKNPSIVQQQMKEKIWSEMIMNTEKEDIIQNYLQKYYENKQQRKELIDSEKQFKKELLDKLSQELEVPREKIWVDGLTVGINNYLISEELIANIQQISVSHCMTTNKKNIEFSLDDYDNDIEL